MSTPGVTRIVKFGGEPAAIPSEEIEALQRLVTADVVKRPWKYLPTGTMVLIESGPLKGISGVFDSINERQSLVLSVTLLQRSIAVQLDPGTEVSVLESGSAASLNGGPTLAASILRARSAVAQ